MTQSHKEEEHRSGKLPYWARTKNGGAVDSSMPQHTASQLTESVDCQFFFLLCVFATRALPPVQKHKKTN